MTLLTIAAAVEAATGAALLVVPPVVVRLLLGAEAAGVSIPICRVTGIALFALSVASWPGPALLGMLTYGTLITVYLSSLGISGEWVGPLLWPAVVAHAAITVLLARLQLAPRGRHEPR
ncbi:MAG TPA: hypothetical protein VMS22_06875 [Candidatus Eisenbacteria bacterium]|nr:hypothetical protein [Candidatus Eisenbacteria bacterium]